MHNHKQETSLSAENDLWLAPYQPKDKEEWDSFVTASRNGTIFHTQAFLSYHSVDRFDDASFLLHDPRGRLRAVCPAVIHADSTGLKILNSHPGSTYGGLVVDPEFTLNESLQAVALTEGHARSLGAQAVEFRHTEKVFQQLPSEDLDFALEVSGFRWSKRELSSALMLAGLTPETILSSMGSRNRGYLKKALRSGLEVRLSDDYAEFHNMLTGTLAQRHAARPTHTLEEMEKLRDILGGRVRLFGGFMSGKIVAGAWLIRCNAKAAHTFYLAQDYAFEHLRPLRAVLHEVIRWQIEHGYRYLNFGISTEDGGRAMNHGLFRFKESFGARGVIRTTYRKDLQ